QGVGGQGPHHRRTASRGRALAVPSISVVNVRYGPNPLYVRQGGDMHYLFDVVFSDEPPAEFDYVIEIQTPDGTTVRTLSGRVATNNQQTVPVAIYTT